MQPTRYPSDWAVVVNPTKFDDLDAMKAEVNTRAGELGWPEPRWLETIEDDPGTGQAQQALDEGASLVCAAGGDGTVRAVGSAMHGSGTPMGILPAGTGNLLARNLGLPLNSPAEAVEAALRGQDRAIDVGLASFGDKVDEPFFVMSGVGLDAQIMKETNPELKHRFGWVAYIGGIVRSLTKRGFTAQIDVDGTPSRHSHSRMVLFCNCPQLTGGLEMAVDGTLDDGELDVVTIRVVGPFGWVAAINELLAKARHKGSAIRQAAGADASVQLNRPVPAELDGDLIDDPVTSFSARVDPGSLLVRVGDAPGQDRNLVGLLKDAITE